MYNEVLLEHNLYPKNRGKLAKAEIERELKNASCGDKIFVQLKIEDGKIVDGKFSGIGCAISLASADLMIEMILSGEDFENEDSMKDLGVSLALEIVARMPARAKCAELAWQIFDVKKEDAEYL